MRTFRRILIFCALIAFPLHRVTAADLELFAFVTPDNMSGGYLSLRITNRGDEERTVLTENFTSYSLGGAIITGSGRHRIPNVHLSFDITTMGTKDDPERWKFVPSLPKLCPVTLQKGETATSGIKLDAEFMQAISKPDQAVRIRYMIGEKLAKRYGLWHGTIEIEKTAGVLLRGEDSQSGRPD